jgi:hypothetical protein
MAFLEPMCIRNTFPNTHLLAHSGCGLIMTIYFKIHIINTVDSNGVGFLHLFGLGQWIQRRWWLWWSKFYPRVIFVVKLLEAQCGKSLHVSWCSKNNVCSKMNDSVSKLSLISITCFVTFCNNPSCRVLDISS